MSERILNVLAPPGTGVVAVTTSAGSVHTIGPAHAAHERIVRLTTSRDDDETLLNLVTGRLETPTKRRTVEAFLRDPKYRNFTTDGEQVWYDTHRVPDALAGDLLFLRECMVDDIVPRDLCASCFFAEALCLLDDEIKRAEFTNLRTKRLIALDTEGRILTTNAGMLFVATSREVATHALRLSDVTAIRRRRGQVVFTVIDHGEVQRTPRR